MENGIIIGWLKEERFFLLATGGAPMNIAVYTNENKDTDLKITRRVAEFLDGKCRVLRRGDFACFDDMCKEADVLIVLGGDGTILRAARRVCALNLPILGINLGTMGFLAEIEPDKIEVSLGRFLSGEYKLDERFMLDAEIVRNGESVATYTALNDAVVSGSSFKRVVSAELYVDGSYITSYDADGVIASTPTGSTAYSLSAGGPITDTAMELMLVTPICPHTLSSRPLIIPPDKCITVKITGSKKESPLLTVDGQEGEKLFEGDEVVIKASARKTRLVRVNGMNFYEILKKKISD